MCEAVWNAGLSVSPESPKEIVSLRPLATMCAYKFKSKYLLIKVDTMRKEEFLDLLKASMLTAPPALGLESRGVYTWIIYSTPSQPHHFAALKVRSFLELGTIHKALVLLTGATKVHAAGEFRIPTDPSVYHVNFESGSYMRKILLPEETDSAPILTPECASDAYAEFVRQKLKDVFPGRIEFKDGTFITATETAKWTALTEEEFDLYRKYGARIELFDSKEECVKARSGAGRKTRRRRGGRLTKSSRVRR